MEFRILGPFEVHGATGRARLGGAKQTALLATLAVRANRLTTVDHVVESTWADSPPVGVTAAVHTYVSRLRRAFDAVEDDGGARIVTRPTGYLLRLAPDELDLDVFRRHVARGREAAAAGRSGEASAELTAGLRLWRGPALVDVLSELIQRTEVPRLTEEMLGALGRRIDADLALGRHVDLIGELRALTVEHPLREQFSGQLMLALYRDGRQAEALDVYREVRDRRVDQLGIDPGPELRRLHQAILSEDPELAGPRRPAAVARPSMPPPMQLPADLVGLVGRAGIADAVAGELSSGADRNAIPIAVLSGLPGVGKTALATHVAHRLRKDFPDGQLHVNLRGYAQAEPVTPTRVLARFLRSLGLSPDLVPLDVDEQAAAYRSLLADKQVLVVLDNANAAEQVRPLLPAAPGCAVLITSRDPLAGLAVREGAVRFDLDVLPARDAVALIASVVGVTVVDSDPEAVAELVDLCGHLPLALRIAAANLSARTPATVRDYVDLLRDGNRMAALAVANDEQTGVRAAFDLSYESLSPSAARLFRMTALVPGLDFTAYTAAALADTTPDEAGRLLDTLVTAGLVQEAGPAHFQLHDLVRYYAAQRGRVEDAATTRDAAVDRLYAHYFRAACAASALIEPIRRPPEPPARLPDVPFPEPADRAAATAWFEQEYPNLHAAVDHAAEHGPRHHTWHLADAMSSPLALAPRFGEWVTVTRTGLRAARYEGDLSGEAIMLVSLGHAYSSTGRMGDAIDALEQALALYQRLDRPVYQQPCHHTLGMSFLWTGRLLKACEHFDRTIELTANGDDGGYYRAGAQHGLGIAYRYLGRLPEALDLLTAAVPVEPPPDESYVQTAWRFTLGLTYRDLDRYAEATTQLTAALAAYERIGNAFGTSRCLVALSGVRLACGDAAEAADAARRGLELSRQVKHRRTEVDALNALGLLSTARGALDEATAHHRQARTIAGAMGPYLYGVIEAEIGLADAATDPATARGHVHTALKSIQDSGFLLHEPGARLTAARVELAAGDRLTAVEHAERALTVALDTGRPLRADRARALLADTAGDRTAGT
ncbi:BTAD domain-containing putative transcriptional regulator [Saccharothrix violaceirubra]|uniref:DNA-binding SARP family transcriptional activator/tetratricopeptide (TPR) repeat protein n=1 Tax=Saccharothrix violaceirubra TaxID=413306 RepID=A0A7W7T663_9PSEU|nr:BTAD domain-containing putative transcriptional regulator [Saccharothrix violaceirubra]MBB4967299.1 DNA-binding SARP family transcriptional activator/tetratricopeptide (TPR) repeat protein [Saccharothrix violaceirubra]